jgi:tryptophan synthase alpha subunit
MTDNKILIQNNKKIRDSLIKATYDLQPDYHIVLTDDLNHRTDNMQILQERIKNFMSQMEQNLLGRHWYNHHYRFMLFVENHKTDGLHGHIVINTKGETMERMHNAISKIESDLIPFIEPITDDTPERAQNIFIYM